MTKIEWVKNQDGSQGRSWNPVTGCTKTSPGCANCYAERMARRLAGRCGYPKAPNHFDVTLHPDRLEQPLKRKKPTTYFVCSMSDLFHKDVPFGFIRDTWIIFARARQHTFQVLTKRPRRMLAFVELATDFYGEPLPNVWLGVSVENSDYLWRVDELMKCPAAVRFVSAEPLLGAIDLEYWLEYDPAAGSAPGIDWVIVRGESGPGARPMHPDWVRGIRDQCVAAGVPFFFKQWGAYLPYDHDPESPMFGIRPDYYIDPDAGYSWCKVGKKQAGRQLDGREWNEMPQ